MIDYMDDEERESQFSKKSLGKILLFLAFLGIILTAMYFFFEGLRGKKETMETSPVTEQASEKSSFSSAAPFILDDGEDKAYALQKKAEAYEIKMEKIKVSLSTEKGDRICEYKDIMLPEILESGNVIDVRLSLADGRDYTVLKRKKVGDFLRKDGKEVVWLSLNNDEVIFMESALTDLSLFQRARLYAVIYNGEEREEVKVNYPIHYKSEKLLKKDEKTGTFKAEKVIVDNELNEDRRRLAEIGHRNLSRWKEAASYWDDK